MRLKINKSKNAINYYAIIDIKTKEGKRSTKVYKRLGNEQEIAKISDGLPPIEWAQKQVAELNKKYKEETLPVIIKKILLKLLIRIFKHLLMLVTFSCKIYITN